MNRTSHRCRARAPRRAPRGTVTSLLSRAHAKNSESGSVSAWAVVISGVLIVSAGLAVDLGGQATAHQRAYDLAAQAARTGGQAIAATAAGGDDLTLDPSAALMAAEGYLRAAGADGHATIIGPATMSVTVTETYQPVLLTVIGVETLTASATADVRLVRSVGGNET